MAHQLGRYEIRERIGEGAMADVYRAYDPQIQRELAIKVLKRELRQHHEYASRFLREAKAAGALSHPNIVTVYDVGEANGIPYIAMELLDGRPLDTLMAERRFSVEEVLHIAAQLAEALRYAHGAGVVHRDIKPSNVMLSRDGRSVKILDFGIARVAEAVGRSELEGMKTQLGQVLGTPRYMSPEQALGAEIDGRSDLFSVGVVLYELVSGKKAFNGASAATLALQITQGEPAALNEAAPDTPRGLQFIITKLMAKRPERRFATGAALAEAVRREQAVIATVAEEAGRRRRMPLAARSALIMATVTALVMSGCVGLVLERQGEALRRMAVTSGSAISTFVATNAALRAVDNASLPPDQRDWLPLQAFVRAASADPNVRAITVADADGIVRGASDETRVGRRYAAPGGEVIVHRGEEIRVSRSLDGAAYRFTRPILYAGQRFGTVDVTLNERDLNAVESLSRLLMAVLGLVVVAVVTAGSYAGASAVVRPIGRLKAALRDAAKGNLDFRISHHRRDEFGELFDGFNTLAAAMQERLEHEAQALDATTIAPAPALAPLASASGPFAAPQPPRAVATLDARSQATAA